METYTIRRFHPGDEQSLSHIMRSAIEQIGPRGYSQQQIEAWAARAHPAQRYLDRAGRGDVVILALDGAAQPVAYSLVEPDGHVDHLYCDPAHAGRGLGKRLLSEVDAVAKELGLTRLYTEASELARPVFERAGYTVTTRRDFDIDGVAIHNYAMEKPTGFMFAQQPMPGPQVT
ncbi:MAG: GNAT family N-acetyltransferase [Sphingomonadaceae bacterium]|nr:GNAT family N-acetyltransferase [Sphingomonadaceae bacterium]